PDSGRILVNGAPITNLASESYLRHFGIVPQDTILFHDTLRSNISYGLQEISDTEIMEAGKLAEISDELLQSPADLDRIVGERGSMISGGQRQRVALARALIHKPSVLVFDEATSALDAVTEQRIMERIYTLASEQNKAVIIVTHTISNLEKADEIIMLEAGTITHRKP
ncbi:MAG: ATP-binding cassette domain-containing protein, partial [Pseudomonadota bacterium]